jgi:flagellin
MTVINTNTAATVTANSMKTNERAMERTMERLSTGKRINSASDDAAGLAIETRMTSQIRGLQQASRNANDGIAMLQTADGAAAEMTNMLQRMRELAVQSQTGTLGTEDIANLNQEFAALATEIDRIADDTTFNNVNIMNTHQHIQIAVGADESDIITATLLDFNLAAGSSTETTEVHTASNVNDALFVAMDPSTAVTVTDNFGNELTLTGAAVTAMTTTAGLAAAINTAAASAVFHGVASGTNATGLIITSTLAGPGTGNADVAYTGTGDPSFSETLGVAKTPMRAALTNFKTEGTADDVNTSGVIVKIDNAIKGIATARAGFGATINRLEYTVDNLNSTVLNTQAAKSQIVDADYAAETTELARTQIISQASTAMLSQANQQAQSVLALLK